MAHYEHITCTASMTYSYCVCVERADVTKKLECSCDNICSFKEDECHKTYEINDNFCYHECGNNICNIWSVESCMETINSKNMVRKNGEKEQHVLCIYGNYIVYYKYLDTRNCMRCSCYRKYFVKDLILTENCMNIDQANVKSIEVSSVSWSQNTIWTDVKMEVCICKEINI